jgi:Fe-Mn family superoxide dismutase
MAHNNNFFFNCLSPAETAMPVHLQKELELSFSSIDTLRQEIIVTASSMFGPGFVWLVKTKGLQKYRLLTTYLAGSPYPGAHFRKQALDMNTQHDDVLHVLNSKAANTVGAFGVMSEPEKKMAPGGIDINPVLCINTWEHVWLPDYGIGAGGAGGKKAYAERWWNRINWSTVASNAGGSASQVSRDLIRH